MPEYIDRQLCEIVAEYDQYYRLVVPLDKIRKIPADDVVPVVRCRECKYWGGTDEYGDGYCRNPDGIDNIAKEDDFCSRGER